MVRRLGEKEVAFIAGDLNGHVGSNPEDYENQYRGYGHGAANKEGERTLEFVQLGTWK